MHFLPDVYVTCDACHGRRFNRETLEVLPGQEHRRRARDDRRGGAGVVRGGPRLARRWHLSEVGLGYLRSARGRHPLRRRGTAGEARQELSGGDTGRTLYLLDEPTTGLHFEDIDELLDVLHGLVDAGNTVVVIEHNLDVIKTADWIIDLGPEGGDGGGGIVAAGTPEDIAKQTPRATPDNSSPRCWSDASRDRAGRNGSWRRSGVSSSSSSIVSTNLARVSSRTRASAGHGQSVSSTATGSSP